MSFLIKFLIAGRGSLTGKEVGLLQGPGFRQEVEMVFLGATFLSKSGKRAKNDTFWHGRTFGGRSFRWN